MKKILIVLSFCCLFLFGCSAKKVNDSDIEKLQSFYPEATVEYIEDENTFDINFSFYNEGEYTKKLLNMYIWGSSDISLTHYSIEDSKLASIDKMIFMGVLNRDGTLKPGKNWFYTIMSFISGPKLYKVSEDFIVSSQRYMKDGVFGQEAIDTLAYCYDLSDEEASRLRDAIIGKSVTQRTDLIDLVYPIHQLSRTFKEKYNKEFTFNIFVIEKCDEKGNVERKKLIFKYQGDNIKHNSLSDDFNVNITDDELDKACSIIDSEGSEGLLKYYSKNGLPNIQWNNKYEIPISYLYPNENQNSNTYHEQTQNGDIEYMDNPNSAKPDEFEANDGEPMEYVPSEEEREEMERIDEYNSSQKSPYVKGQQLIVTSEKANLRNEPSLESKVVGYWIKDDVVTVYDYIFYEKRWWIKTDPNKEWWVSERDLEVID